MIAIARAKWFRDWVCSHSFHNTGELFITFFDPDIVEKHAKHRRSHPEFSCKESVFQKNFLILFLMKLPVEAPQFSQKEAPTQVFSGEFCFQAVYTEGLHMVASENKKGESNRHQLTEHGKYKRRMKKDYLWMLLNSL